MQLDSGWRVVVKESNEGNAVTGHFIRSLVNFKRRSNGRSRSRYISTLFHYRFRYILHIGDLGIRTVL